MVISNLSKEQWGALQQTIALMIANQTAHERIISEIERTLHTNVYVAEPYAMTWQIERIPLPALIDQPVNCLFFASICKIKKSFLFVPIQLSSKKPFHFLVEMQQMPSEEALLCFRQTFQLASLAYNQRRILWKHQVMRHERSLKHYFEGKRDTVIQTKYATMPYTVVYGRLIEHSLDAEQKRMWEVLRCAALQLDEHHFVHSCFRYDHGVLFILPSLHEANWQSLVIKMFENVSECLRVQLHENIRFGISNEGMGSTHFLRRVEEAVSASKRKDTASVTMYDQKSLSELIELIPQRDLMAFTENILQPFDLVGVEERKMLLDTVDVYLECHCQISETAKQLFVHRNTVIYRLEKCQTLLKMDLKHPDTSLQLRFALRLHKALFTKSEE